VDRFHHIANGHLIEIDDLLGERRKKTSESHLLSGGPEAVAAPAGIPIPANNGDSKSDFATKGASNEWRRKH